MNRVRRREPVRVAGGLRRQARVRLPAHNLLRGGLVRLRAAVGSDRRDVRRLLDHV